MHERVRFRCVVLGLSECLESGLRGQGERVLSHHHLTLVLLPLPLYLARGGPGMRGAGCTRVVAVTSCFWGGQLASPA